MKTLYIACALALATTTLARAADTADLARRFGAREGAHAVRLSPDGDKVVFLSPADGARSTAMVADIATGKLSALFTDKGTDMRVTSCGWKSEARLICTLIGVSAGTGVNLVGFERLLAVDPDGGHPLVLGQRTNVRQIGGNQSGGTIIDWLPDDPQAVLMAISLVPENDIGTHLASTAEGMGVERVNVLTGSRSHVEPPKRDGAMFMSDGHGHVRGMGLVRILPTGVYETTMHYLARPAPGAGWQPVMDVDLTQNVHPELDGFDESGDGLFLLKPDHGRQALFRRDLKSGTESLIYARPEVDVDGLYRVGKYRRPIAVSYALDAEELHFIDPAFERLSNSLTGALPGRPRAYVLGESWDGHAKLVFAGSDVNPGHYYRYDAGKHELNELLPVHPALADMTISPEQIVRYPAKDGTQIPALLTLPPGKTTAKGLPVVVMPHGGPSARDQWGFDWLSQFFAQAGYAVLQPNYRGSAGYGEAWFAQNGFKGWRTAMGDINDGARWLVREGADGRRLAIVGWSYGGYAALQANVLEPDLYKAAVAVAPVTDLDLLLEHSRQFANHQFALAEIGSGAILKEGSPAENAAAIKAPVLMFQGTRDLNVDPAQASLMDRALARAGKRHELVVYPGLAHDLADGTVRADLLKRSADFLAANMPPG